MKQTPTPRTDDPVRPAAGITARGVLVGLALIPLNSFYVVRLERVLFGPYPSTISLFANAVFALFVFVGLNRLLRRFAPRLAFSQGDLLVIYVMLGISTGLAGLDGVCSLNQIIAHGAWFNPNGAWTKFLNAFPPWLVVRDKSVLRGHFLGHSSLYDAEVLRAWIAPVICWTFFITLLLFVANCVNVLVRRQWADQERLTFPLIWLPLAMVDEGPGFFGSGLMWMGFAVAGGLNLWNGAAFLLPSLPSIPLGITDFKPLLTMKPWVGIDWLPVTFYPMVVGLGYLLPLDLLFSCWFFYLFWKAQLVITNAFAWDTTPDFPFIKEQGFGAVMGLFLFYLWSGRRTYAAIWRRAWQKSADDALTSGARPQEALSDRSALLGIALRAAGLILFCRAAGVAWWVACAFFALYLPTLIVITRIRAELGPPVHDFHFMGPDNMIPRIAGTSGLHQGDLAFFTFSFAFTRAHRSDTMPIGLEALQMARVRLPGSSTGPSQAVRMFSAVMIAVVAGTLSAFWAFEHQAYQVGAATKFNQGFGFASEAFTRMASWVGGTLDARPNMMAISAVVVGLATSCILFLLRLRFYGFPFHPIGYAISSSWAINLVWVPLLIAWVLKGLTMRYGGLRAYRRALPFFLGLILGDCVIGTVWGLVSLAFNVRTYSSFGA